MPSRFSTRLSSTPARRSSSPHTKTEIKIHVYDLLPPSKLSTMLWFMGTSLLHSGVVINNREYAYGGHGKRGLSGVYWTRPSKPPPGGTFKCAVLHGFTFASPAEVEAVIRDVSAEFLGTSYNLLLKNCNHFTSHLCHMLTGRPGPSWLNRAASIGVALPCVVPREWIEPPAFNTADGELVEEEDDDEAGDEQSRMLRQDSQRTLTGSSGTTTTSPSKGQGLARTGSAP